MQTHGPKRVYTPRSVEFWFGKLSGEWEQSFSERQLEEGAKIYREGEVRELELTDHDAIVHRRVEKRDEYVVIEWDASGLRVRSSTTDAEVSRALAVAGLHEIEELVADEISPLPDDSPPPAAGEIGSTRCKKKSIKVRLFPEPLKTYRAFNPCFAANFTNYSMLTGG